MFRIVPQFPYQATPSPVHCACLDGALAASSRRDGGQGGDNRNGLPRWRKAPFPAGSDARLPKPAPIEARRRMAAPTRLAPIMNNGRKT